MKKIIILIFICFSQLTNSQIKLDEFVQQPELTTSNEHQLFFIDLWATWCVPCVTAKKYLGVIQEQFPNELLITSITNENSIKVNKYLKRNPTKLAIAIDYNSELNNKINPPSFPYGVMYNAQGDIIWEGTSTNLKPYMIQKFLRKHQVKKTLNEFFEIVKIKEAKELINYKLSEPIHFVELVDNKTFRRIENDSIIKSEGSLQMIISDLTKMNANQIILDEVLNKNYTLFFKKETPESEVVIEFLNSLDIKLNPKTSTGKVLVLDNTNTSYWDKNQFDWKSNSQKFLISDTDIEADNVSLNDLIFKLTHLINLPIILKYKDESIFQPHDWQLHYKYETFMIENFFDNYNISAEIKETNYTVFELTKS